MSTCDYEYNDNWDTDYHVCELEAGHDGPHRVVLEWETRPADICRKEGHAWGEWKPWTERPTSFFMAEWKALPTHWRVCSRGCGSMEYQGGEKNVDISDILLSSLVPRPIRAPIFSDGDAVRALSEFSVKIAEDKR